MRCFWPARLRKSSLRSARANVRGNQFVSQLYITEEQEILKLHPRNRESIEKYIVGFHNTSLIGTDRDKLENRQSCPLTVCLSLNGNLGSS